MNQAPKTNQPSAPQSHLSPPTATQIQNRPAKAVKIPQLADYLEL